MQILKCNKCHSYALEEQCKCGGKAVSPRPAKYSPEDKYGAYRRKVKREQIKEEFL